VRTSNRDDAMKIWSAKRFAL